MKTFLTSELSTPEERAKLIRPIEELFLPSTLDGSAAWATPWNPEEPVAYFNDIEAIKAWVDGYSGASMRQACRTALEKILLWCVVERGHALAELSGEEVGLFIRFLMHLEPRSRWMTYTTGHRSSVDWRPFKSPMEASRVGATLRFIYVYFRWANANGLRLLGRPLHALTAPLKDERSAMASENRPLALHRITTPVWVALHRFLQGDSESYKDLQVLGFHQLLYYGAISQRQIARLRLKDFIAHQRNGNIVAWEFPSGDAHRSTVVSCGPLTNTLTKLLGLTPVPKGGSRHEVLIFEGCSLRATNALKHAKVHARTYFQNAGELDRGASLSNLKLVHLRGAVISNVHREAASLDLASVFSWIYLKKYPHINRYFGTQMDWDAKKRLESAANLSDWIYESERSHLARSKLPP
ncbi:hypothetical protein LP415_13895 [Polaromonas sp. P1(28)-8]|nr:hypothetical protein LP415_13895 [Polaromonas sp. P1(28)-8]